MLTPMTDPAPAPGDQFVQSLARGLSVITAFDADHPAMTLSDIAGRTGLSRATARRFLHTLVELGYVRFDGKQFALTPQVLRLGTAYLSGLGLPQLVQPHLEQLSARLGESTSAAVLDGDEIVYVARAATQRIISVGLSVGSRLPAYCTSMGRVLLAFSSANDLDAFLDRVPLVRQTPHTIVEAALLRRELQRIRAEGYSLVDQELELGLRSIAVPVRQSDGRAVAAINVGAQAARVDLATMTQSYLPVLREAAEQIALGIAR
jgi:IclR family pca regulon transcriptional regulator